MASAREQLKAILQQRQAQAGQDDSKLRGMINQQEDIAMLDTNLRTNLAPTMSFFNSLNEDSKPIGGGYEAPESTQDALRKALNYRMQQPKANSDALLMAMSKQEGGGFRDEKEAQRMRESAVKSKEGQAIMKDRELQNNINNYKSLVNKFGFQAVGKDRALLENAHNQLLISYKNSAELGVLAGPDMNIINSVAPPSTGFGNIFGNQLKGGVEGVNAALDNLSDLRGQNIDKNKRVLESVYAAPGTQGALNSLYSNGQQAQQQSGFSQSGNSMDMGKMSESELDQIIAAGKR